MKTIPIILNGDIKKIIGHIYDEGVIKLCDKECKKDFKLRKENKPLKANVNLRIVPVYTSSKGEYKDLHSLNMKLP